MSSTALLVRPIVFIFIIVLQLASAALPELNTCLGQPNERESNWVGRYCTHPHQHPGGLLTARKWWDLCWNPTDTLWGAWAVDHNSPKQTFTNGWGNPKQPRLMLKQSASTLWNLGVVNLDRLPTRPGYQLPVSHWCPEGYWCSQFLDTDDDAHIACVRMYPWSKKVFPERDPYAADFLMPHSRLSGEYVRVEGSMPTGLTLLPPETDADSEPEPEPVTTASTSTAPVVRTSLQAQLAQARYWGSLG